MQRGLKPRTVPIPSFAITLAAGLLLALVVSVVVQPPRQEGVDTLQRMLAWLRAALFSAGALAFVIALVQLLRTPRLEVEHPVALTRSPRSLVLPSPSVAPAF